jgi:hypothetical protein
MILLAIPSLLVGAVLAQRFKVMILLPATAMVLVLAAGTGLIQSYTVGWTMVLAAAGGASMHVGYLFGLGLRCLLEVRSMESPQPARANASARHSAQTTSLN